jgi:hypothetical protein
MVASVKQTAQPPCFSSLQPLSTLLQLEQLDLQSHACTATSLQGLPGLSNLKLLSLGLGACGVQDQAGSRIRSLEGISPGLVQFSISFAPDLVSLAGIEGCTSMEKLSLGRCGVSSLQPLRGLTSLKDISVMFGSLTSLEGLNDMSLYCLSLMCCSNLSYLSGLGHISDLKSLHMMQCGVTSLQPLSQLGEGLQTLSVSFCEGVQEEVLELPHVQPTADVDVKHSNVREVVLAGGVRKAARIWQY